MEKPNFRLAIIWTLLAWLGFAVSFLLSKIIHPHTTISTMSFFRCLVGTVAFLPYLWIYRKERVWPKRPVVMFLRALTGLLNVVFIFWSLKSISLVDSTLLLNSFPFFVPFVAWLCLRHPVNHRLWLPMGIGFLGVIFILKPDKNLFEPGALYALAAGIVSAFSMILIRLLTGSEKIQIGIFYTFAMALVLVAPFAIVNWHVDAPVYYWPLIGIGCGVLLGQWGLFKSLQYAKPGQVAPFGYAVVVYSLIFDWLIFHEIPGSYSAIGFLLIIGAGVSILRLRRA